MTLAVMSRASLGHTCRALVASPARQAVYALAFAAALARVCAVLQPEWSGALLPIAAFAWSAAFLGFASLYAPILCLKPSNAWSFFAGDPAVVTSITSREWAKVSF